MTLDEAKKILPGARYVREWSNYILADRREYGCAARGNRSRHSGTKVHALTCSYVVAVIDPAKETNTRTMGYKFMQSAKPQLFSVHPVCGCTSGQHAGQPIAHYTADHVTCTKCPQPSAA